MNSCVAGGRQGQGKEGSCRWMVRSRVYWFWAGRHALGFWAGRHPLGFWVGVHPLVNPVGPRPCHPGIIPDVIKALTLKHKP